ncbi:hypothetical protein GCM10010423_30240 [Streptomyces levis]|uniref:Uncharacterized protein n=1 Tax=Streptomyces levis TaxID=285566 RepID=A0ABN3NRI0_9ACTN
MTVPREDPPLTGRAADACGDFPGGVRACLTHRAHTLPMYGAPAAGPLRRPGPRLVVDEHQSVDTSFGVGQAFTGQLAADGVTVNGNARCSEPLVGCACPAGDH